MNGGTIFVIASNVAAAPMAVMRVWIVGLGIRGASIVIAAAVARVISPIQGSFEILLLGEVMAGVVEEELLGVAAVWAEVGVGEFSNFCGGAVLFVFFGEVELEDDAFYPDVDGEGVVAGVGEEENAIGYFGADTS